MFDNADQVKIFENSAYFQPGRYIVSINACKLITNGHNGDSFVVECKVLGALSESPTAPVAGALAAHVWNASGDKRDMARATWFGFLCACFGVEQSAYDNAQWKQISEQVIEHGALNGKIQYLECFNKPTRAGNPFTKHNWKGTPTAELMAEFGLNADGTAA
ncbi:MAG: hypothetical protein QGG14_07725 [Planctomycetota bacterium]|jgi:hypothetical protein|nr:hypothetical protein [Planctomycetota bacterium]